MDIVQKPKWAEAKDKLMPHPEKMDAKGERKALDVMLSERDKETKTSAKARQWEKDRKKEWKDNYPAYIKDVKSKEPKDPAMEAMKSIKSGGEFDTDVHPFTNYLLVEPIREKATSAGILLPTESEPNTAYIIESSKQGYTPTGELVELNLPKGTKILFRKFAGMEVTVKGKDLLMLTLADVIALID